MKETKTTKADSKVWARVKKHAKKLEAERRAAAAARCGHSNVLAGHKALKDSEVRVAREVYASGAMSLAELARLFGVSAATIHNAVHRKTYTSVE